MTKVAARVKSRRALDRRGRRGYRKAMSDTVKAPEDCATMAEVRAGVDALDRELVALLATRFGYMRAAARIKPSRGTVRDEGRKSQVIEAAKADAAARSLPADEIAAIWNSLVEASIAYELVEWDRIRLDA